MKLNSNERGALSVLIAVLVVALVVVAGLAIYNVNKSRQKDAQTNASPPPISSPASTASPLATPTPANVFVVKELGIQFTVSDDIRDLRYVVKTNNGQSSAYFSTTSLETADRNAGGQYCTAERDAPLGIIDLATNTPGGEQAIKKIGDKYLNYAHAQSACSQNTSVMSLANKQAQAFRQALETAEAAR